MTISVHTNKAALTALQNLNRTNDELGLVQNKVNTGLAIGSAKDNAAVWSIAQGQRADIGGLSAVKMSLQRAQSIADVSLTAGESISDLLVQMKEKVVAAMDPSYDADARTALNSDFKSILAQIQQVIANSVFDGANILNGSQGTGIQFLADADATQHLTLSGQNLNPPGTTTTPPVPADEGTILTVPAGADILTAANATTVMGQLTTSISQVNQALGALGSQSKQIEAHLNFISKLTDQLQAGVGNLVDADLAKESANLQALQVQQQLGAQALSIANSAPQIVLQLFRGG